MPANWIRMPLVAVWTVLTVSSLFAQVAAPSETLLPAETKGFVCATNVKHLQAQWDKTQLGQLMKDPLMEPFTSDLFKQFQSRFAENYIKLGLDWEDIQDVPSGEVAMARIQPGPGKAALGMIGGRAETARQWFRPGKVGVTSRSGGMTSAMAYYLTQAGMGQSTIVHVGGDSVVGTAHPEVVELFQNDEQTEMVAMFGEIGTTQEERVADMIELGKFTKPLIAFIGGKAAKSGTRFSHAGAIVEGTRGSYASKVERLRSVGVHIAESIFDIPEIAKRLSS